MKKNKKYIAKEGVRISEKQAYDDSLLLSNEASKFDKLAKSGKYNYPELLRMRDQQAPVVYPSFKRLAILNGDVPQPIRTNTYELDDGIATAQLYQSPKGKKKTIKKEKIDPLDILGLQEMPETQQDIVYEHDLEPVQPIIKDKTKNKIKRISQDYITGKTTVDEGDFREGGQIAKKAKKLQSGIVVDKNTNMAKIYENFSPVDSFPVITGKNSLNDKPNLSTDPEVGFQAKNTPAGDYTLKPNSNIYGHRGYEMNNDKLERILAVHTTYDPAHRGSSYAKKDPRARDLSYGCVNCRPEDIEKLYSHFPEGDTLEVLPRTKPNKKTKIENKVIPDYSNNSMESLGDEKNNFKNGGKMKKGKKKYIIGGEVEIPGKSVFDHNEGKNPVPQAPQIAQNNFGTGPLSTPADAPQPNNGPAPTGNNLDNQQGITLDFKNPLEAKNWNPEGGVNTNNLFAGAVAGISGLLPYQKPQDNNKKIVEAYNPYPQGTGSHSTYKKGGKIKAQDGKKVPTNYFKTDKTAFIDSAIAANTTTPFVQDLYNPNIEQNDPSRDLTYSTDENDFWVHPENMDYFDARNKKNAVPFDSEEKATYFTNNAMSQKTPIPMDIAKQRFPKKANGGVVTPEERDQWEALQTKAYQKGFLGDNHNPKVGADFAQAYGFNPERIGAIQQDFQDLNNTNPDSITNIGAGLSPVDNFYGNKTAQQRYKHYSVQHNNEKPQEFGTNQKAAYIRSNQLQGVNNDEWAGFGKPENNIKNISKTVTQPQAVTQTPSVKKVSKKQKSNYFTNENTDYSLDATRDIYEYGGNVPIGADGLQIEDDKYKMLSPKTAEIKGNTHENGGTDISFKGNEVEAETGEPISIAEDGQAVIFGNMVVPGTRTKFKDAAKLIAKEEKKNAKVEKKGTNLLNIADPYNSYEGASFNTGKVLHDASFQKEAVLIREKENLAKRQQIMLDVAEGLGKDPKEISRMGKGKSKYGIKMPKAKEGYRFDENVPDVTENPTAIPYVGDASMGEYNNFLNRKNDTIAPMEVSSPVGMYEKTQIDSILPSLKTMDTVPDDIRAAIVDVPQPSLKTVSPTRFKGYKNKLGISDFLAEIPEALDQVQPVARQQFNPQLYSPYSVSFDDRIAANQGDFNGIEKTLKNNPAALGALAAQKYSTNNQIKSDEFRTNQGIASDTTNKNNGLINQDNEMNIKLGDEQMVRQAQAQENTKANRNAALVSIANKLNANRSENAKNQMYSDLYHFGYDPSKGFYHDDNYAAVMQYAQVHKADLNPDIKTKTKKYKYNPNKTKSEETDTQLAMGGYIAGRNTDSYIKKNKKKYVK